MNQRRATISLALAMMLGLTPTVISGCMAPSAGSGSPAGDAPAGGKADGNGSEAGGACGLSWDCPLDQVCGGDGVCVPRSEMATCPASAAEPEPEPEPEPLEQEDIATEDYEAYLREILDTATGLLSASEDTIYRYLEVYRVDVGDDAAVEAHHRAYMAGYDARERLAPMIDRYNRAFLHEAQAMLRDTWTRRARYAPEEAVQFAIDAIEGRRHLGFAVVDEGETAPAGAHLVIHRSEIEAVMAGAECAETSRLNQLEAAARRDQARLAWMYSTSAMLSPLGAEDIGPEPSEAEFRRAVRQRLVEREAAVYDKFTEANDSKELIGSLHYRYRDELIERLEQAADQYPMARQLVLAVHEKFGEADRTLDTSLSGGGYETERLRILGWSTVGAIAVLAIGTLLAIAAIAVIGSFVIAGAIAKVTLWSVFVATVSVPVAPYVGAMLIGLQERAKANDALDYYESRPFDSDRAQQRQAIAETLRDAVADIQASRVGLTEGFGTVVAAMPVEDPAASER
jgi:hypothetical protein